MNPRIEIVTCRIDTGSVIASVGDPHSGGTAVFIGTIRDRSGEREVRYLEYEAYTSMALREMTRIAGNAASKWPLGGIAIVHRSGRVHPGEAGVVIAVSSEHRNAAFEACRYLIDTLKKEVPIWKKEVYSDGSQWTGPAPEGGGPPARSEVRKMRASP